MAAVREIKAVREKDAHDGEIMVNEAVESPTKAVVARHRGEIYSTDTLCLSEETGPSCKACCKAEI